jgi:LmbE family N-acetylglucosaminyl deacetylase
MTIFLSPHNDDETLFGTFTLLRERPLVVICTDGYNQGERGDPITAEQRREETREAMKLLKCPVIFLGIKDTELSGDNLETALSYFKADKVYAPAIQGGNSQHDLVGKVADLVFNKVIHYTTYTKSELHTTGRVEIVPNTYEIGTKKKALQCYQSQLNLGSTRPHFEAVLGKSEYYE